jgi:hypothetical protein
MKRKSNLMETFKETFFPSLAPFSLMIFKGFPQFTFLFISTTTSLGFTGDQKSKMTTGGSCDRMVVEFTITSAISAYHH